MITIQNHIIHDFETKFPTHADQCKNRTWHTRSLTRRACEGASWAIETRLSHATGLKLPRSARLAAAAASAAARSMKLPTRAVVVTCFAFCRTTFALVRVCRTELALCQPRFVLECATAA